MSAASKLFGNTSGGSKATGSVASKLFSEDAAPVAAPTQTTPAPVAEKQPTLGGAIVRELGRPFVRLGAIFAKPIDQATGLDHPDTNAYFGDVSPAGFRPGDTPGQRAKDLAGNLLETTSAFYGGAELKGLSKTQKLLTLAKEGATIGGVGAAGAELQKKDSTLGSVLKSGATGAVGGAILNPIVGTAASKLFGRAAPEIAQAAEKEATKSSSQVARDFVSTLPKKAEKPPLYEPYVPPEQLPTINFGARSKSDLPSIPFNAPDSTHLPSGMSYEPIKQPTLPTTPQFTQPEIPAGPIASTNASVKLPSTKGNAVTKAAADLNSRAVEQGFNSLQPDELARYQSVNIPEAKQSIANLLTNLPPEETYQMGITGKKIPKDIPAELLYKALSQKADLEGNGQAILDLAKSPLATKESLSGQTLRLSQEYGDSTVDIVRDINKRRTNPEALTKEFENVKSAVQKTEVKTTRQSLKDFIDSIPDC